MPALPASTEEATGKTPLTPACARTRLTGGRQSGCEEVEEGEEVTIEVGLEDSEADGIGVGVLERVCEPLGVGVPVEDNVMLDDPVSELLSVGVPVRVGSGLDERDEELLGVSVGVDVSVAPGVAGGLRELDSEPVRERVDDGVCVTVELDVCVDEGLPVREEELVTDELAVRVLLGEYDRVAVGVPKAVEAAVPEELEASVPDCVEVAVLERVGEVLSVEAEEGIELTESVLEGVLVTVGEAALVCEEETVCEEEPVCVLCEEPEAEDVKELEGVPVREAVLVSVRRLETVLVKEEDGDGVCVTDGDPVREGVAVSESERDCDEELVSECEDELVLVCELEADDVREEELELVCEEVSAPLRLGEGASVEELEGVPEAEGDRDAVDTPDVLALLVDDGVGAGVTLRRLAMLRPR